MSVSGLVPTFFCWTRFGTEAGETIDAIARRKEAERAANGGLFLWGIGNAVGAAVAELARRRSEPELLFSPIKGAPRRMDVAPERVVEWTAAQTAGGTPYKLPPHSRVTSRWTGQATKCTHYALVCFSSRPIELVSDGPKIFPSELRNLLSGRPVGASQVTAVVTVASSSEPPASGYPVALRVTLRPPYFVRLTEPRRVERP